MTVAGIGAGHAGMHKSDSRPAVAAGKRHHDMFARRLVAHRGVRSPRVSQFPGRDDPRVRAGERPAGAVRPQGGDEEASTNPQVHPSLHVVPDCAPRPSRQLARVGPGPKEPRRGRFELPLEADHPRGWRRFHGVAFLLHRGILLESDGTNGQNAAWQFEGGTPPFRSIAYGVPGSIAAGFARRCLRTSRVRRLEVHMRFSRPLLFFSSSWPAARTGHQASAGRRDAPGRRHRPVSHRTPAKSVILAWTSPASEGSRGYASRYEIRRAAAELTESGWATATIVSAPRVPKPVP